MKFAEMILILLFIDWNISQNGIVWKQFLGMSANILNKHFIKHLKEWTNICSVKLRKKLISHTHTQKTKNKNNKWNEIKLHYNKTTNIKKIKTKNSSNENNNNKNILKIHKNSVMYSDPSK